MDGRACSVGQTFSARKCHLDSLDAADFADEMHVNISGMPIYTRYLASQLYQLSAHDPWSLAAACLGVLLVSLVAGFIPARRAASIEPMRALRTE